MIDKKVRGRPSRGKFIAPRTARARKPLLDQRRALKMAKSAHAYVRGNTRQFYDWLEQADTASIPRGPDIWICGDCHIGNLGPVSDAEGNIDIQIRDLDQTVIGNPAHDLIRLALSLSMAARSSDLPGVMTARMLEAVMLGYRRSMRRKPDDTRSLEVSNVLKQATRRTWRHMAKERLENLKPDIPIGKRFWPLTRAERAEVERMFGTPSMHTLLTTLSHRDADSSIEVFDAAYWVKGCSSLGRLRMAVLAGAKRSDDALRHSGLCLVDIKQATAPAAPRAHDAPIPQDHAQRIVAGARALSPNLGNRMLATRFLNTSVVVRELLPQDLKFDISAFTSHEALAFAEYLAHVVGRAHWHQMDVDAKRDWSRQLGRSTSKTLDAPTWLWSSVVELVGRHEAGYLEHCRRYALQLPTVMD